MFEGFFPDLRPDVERDDAVDELPEDEDLVGFMVLLDEEVSLHVSEDDDEDLG